MEASESSSSGWQQCRGTVRRQNQNERSMCILRAVALNEPQMSQFDFHILLMSHVIQCDDFKHFSSPSNNTSSRNRKREHLRKNVIHWKFCYQSAPAFSLCAAGHFLTCWNCVHSWECAQVWAVLDEIQCDALQELLELLWLVSVSRRMSSGSAASVA